MVLNAEIKKRIKQQQTETLIDYIRTEQITSLNAYLNHLTLGGQALTDAVNFSLDDNFLTAAVKTNNAAIVSLLLETLNKTETEDIRTHSIALFALAFAQTDQIALQLYKYLTQLKNLNTIINTYILAAFKISIHVTNQPGPARTCELIINGKPEEIHVEGPCIDNRAGRHTIEALFIHNNKRKNDKNSLFIQFLFQYAVMNNRNALAKYILNLSTFAQSLVNQKNNSGLTLAHQCLGSRNYEGIIFLVKSGATLCSNQNSHIATEGLASDRTVIQLMIIKKDNHGLRALLNGILTLTDPTEITNCLPVFAHLIQVYTDCDDVSVLKVFDEFGFAKLLRQLNEAPAKSELLNISQPVYLSITPLLKQYYKNKLQILAFTEAQLPLIKARMFELESLLEVLNNCNTGKVSSFSFCLLCFNNYIKSLPKKQRNEINFAVDKLKGLGFMIDDFKITSLIKRFGEIKDEFSKDIIQLENLKRPFRDYPTNVLAESLLQTPQTHNSNHEDTELMLLTGSLRTPLLQV